MNFLECDWRDGAAIQGVAVSTASTQAPATTSLTVGIRPEYLEVHDAAGANRIPARIVAVRDQGTHTMVQLDIGSRLAWSRVRNTRRALQPGPAFVYLPADKCALYADDRRLP